MSATIQVLVWIAVASLYAILTATAQKRIYVTAFPGVASALLLSLLGVPSFIQCVTFVTSSALCALLFEYT